MNCGVTLFSLSHPFTSFARMWNHHKSHGSFGFARNQSRYFLGIHHCHCPNCSWMLIPTKTRQRTVKNPRSPNLPMVKPGISLTFLGFFLHLKSTLISLCFPPDLQNSPSKAASNPQPGSNRPLKADSFPNPVGPFRAGSSRWPLPQLKNHGVWRRRQVGEITMLVSWWMMVKYGKWWWFYDVL